MKFDFVAFKDSLVELEKTEWWVEEFERLKAEWDRTHDPRLGGLCVDQCFYFEKIVEHDAIIKGKPWKRDFQRKYGLFLDEVVGYGLNNGFDNPYFLWRVGHWMIGGRAADICC